MVALTIKVIIDYDGTLTYEEKYVSALRKKAIKDLAENILNVSVSSLTKIYQQTQTRILLHPSKHSWIVNSLPACYASEGALLLNTVIIQTLLTENKHFGQAVKDFFPKYQYDPIVDCTDYLFHKHSFSLSPHFRESAREVLLGFIKQAGLDPYILTCSKGDKVAKNLRKINLGAVGYSDGLNHKLKIFGDTRQYEMDPDWDYYFDHSQLGKIQEIPVDKEYSIDLRRPIYYQKLKQVMKDGSRVIVTADMVSLAGILPLIMGLDFVLLKASYTPKWAVDFVSHWKNGWVIDNINQLPQTVEKIMVRWFLEHPL